MAFGQFDSGEDNSPLAEINMVPFIDIMLVLLIIFMVTAPLLTHAVKIDLPRATSTPNPSRPDHVPLAIDADGQVYWNGAAVSDAQLVEHLTEAASLDPQPELQIRAERTVAYEKVAQVLSTAARQGLHRIGFVTDPTAAAPLAPSAGTDSPAAPKVEP